MDESLIKLVQPTIIAPTYCDTRLHNHVKLVVKCKI